MPSKKQKRQIESLISTRHVAPQDTTCDSCGLLINTGEEYWLVRSLSSNARGCVNCCSSRLSALRTLGTIVVRKDLNYDD